MNLTKLLQKIRINPLEIVLVMVSFCFILYNVLKIIFFISLGVDAVKDKVDEKKSELSKESNKDSAEHEAKGIVETVKEKAAEA